MTIKVIRNSFLGLTKPGNTHHSGLFAVRHFNSHRFGFLFTRNASDIPKSSSAAQLMALRKKFESVSLSKLKKALSENNHDIKKASRWVIEYLRASQPTDKILGRPTQEGIICMVSRRGVGSVMMGMDCETDFVAKNQVFLDLVGRMAGSILYLGGDYNSSSSVGNTGSSMSGRMYRLVSDHLQNPSSNASQVWKGWSDLPLLPKLEANIDSTSIKNLPTISQGVSEAITKLGENIKFGDGVMISAESPSAEPRRHWGMGLHGTVGSVGSVDGNYAADTSANPNQWINVKFGKIGCMVLLEQLNEDSPSDLSDSELTVIADKVAQHIIGMTPASIPELLEQPFLFDQSKTVGQVVQSFGSVISQFVRLEVGDKGFTEDRHIQQTPQKDPERLRMHIR